LEANLPNLQKIYQSYKTPTKQFPEIEDLISMCTRDSVLNLTEKDIAFCFGYCHMTVVNEDRLWKSY